MKKQLIVGLLLAGILLTGCDYFNRSAKEYENVFDEMYLSVTDTKHKVSFQNSDNFMGDYTVYYDIKSQDFPGTLSVSVNSVMKSVTVKGQMNFGKERLAMTFAYSVSKRELYQTVSLVKENGFSSRSGKDLKVFMDKHKLTKEKIKEYQDKILYEHVLKSWVTGNKEYSKFSENNYGNFKINDATFKDLDFSHKNS